MHLFQSVSQSVSQATDTRPRQATHPPLTTFPSPLSFIHGIRLWIMALGMQGWSHSRPHRPTSQVGKEGEEPTHSVPQKVE